MRTDEWLASLKAGDLVHVDERGAGSICKVSRVTAAAVFVTIGGFEARFNRKSGRRVGSTRWSFSYITPYSEDVAARIRDASVKRWARYSAGEEIAALPASDIEQVRALVLKLKERNNG